MRYRSDIDGLRSLAVLPVVFFHAGLGFPGGFVGVDVFFVISGYLITRLLIDDLDGGRFSIVEFYHRRARRILPALMAVVAATLAAASVVMLPGDLADAGESALAALFFLSNIHFYLSVGYFDQAAELKPLLHTWSLGIEEQFYLGLPLLIWLVAAAGQRRRLTLILALATVASFLLALRWQFPREAGFYLPQPRAWELGIGALLAASALRLDRAPGWVAEALALAGLAAILLPVFLYDRHTPFPGWTALPPVLGTAALLLAGTGPRTTAVGRMLSLPPLVGVGLISYSLYLWHWPVIVLARYGSPEEPGLLASVAHVLVAMALAWASWKLVESPVRRRQVLASRPRLFAGLGAISLALSVALGAVVASGGLPERIDPVLLAMTDRAALLGSPVGCNHPTGAARLEPCRIGAGAPAQIVAVLVGDSHAARIARPLAAEAAARGLSVQMMTADGFLPWRRGYGRLTEQMIRAIAGLPPSVPVILAGNWVTHSSGFHFRNGPDPTGPWDLDADRRAGFAAALERFLAAMDGRRVVVLDDVPHSRGLDGGFIARLHLSRQQPEAPGQPRATVEMLRAWYATVLVQLAASGKAEYLPGLVDALCDTTACPLLDTEGRSLWADGDHLSALGAERLRPWTRALLDAVAPPR